MLESKLITFGMTSTLQYDLCEASVDICEVCLRAGVVCFCGWTAAVTVADFYLETRKNLEDHIRVRRSCFPSEVLVQKCLFWKRDLCILQMFFGLAISFDCIIFPQVAMVVCMAPLTL